MESFKGKVPARLSPHIIQAIEHLVLGEGPIESERQSQAVAGLSRLFTRERAALPQQYLDDPDHAAAYLRYFLPVNLCKIQVLLDELPGETIVRGQNERIAVLDLGCGPGTGGLAALDWLQQRHPERVPDLSVVAADHSRQALRSADRLWDIYCRESCIGRCGLQTHAGNLERPLNGSLGEKIRAGGPYSLIILANCLNELYTDVADPAGARASLVAGLLPLLRPDGTVVLLEPALRQTARGLHQVRDRLLQEQQCTVYSPCLHEDRCPALVNPADWCHEERAWEAPASIQAIDQAVGFIKDALKFSYLLLRKDGRTIVPHDPRTFRVVSELRELKGDTRAWVCNELGRSDVGRLDRAESEANSAWDDCQRGTIVRIEGLKRKEGSTLGRIPAEGTVEIIRPV
jgi:ribosomal protein RSM22 (predicted rRNA methylase)